MSLTPDPTNGNPENDSYVPLLVLQNKKASANDFHLPSGLSRRSSAYQHGLLKELSYRSGAPGGVKKKWAKEKFISSPHREL
ncbi:hypothetical protein N7471_005391 [Penicillium samsonianum]|uniref:uncharacterized protein n=1 Tax=Penicillium samsonianum TaxID=1882272 RepID=UPI002549AC25|nr:uncharacterized protein N7471_005391 [Penicillium samsonianum]KAJ6138905.1 hypothetical protein N7471_005391 [Penicillium samsonianum]